MTTQEIAQRLVTLCRQGQSDQAYKELFADDAVSLEPTGFPNAEVKGLNNLLVKSQQFQEMTEEFHSLEVSEPIVAGDHFSVVMTLDATMKGRPRATISEIIVYEITEGKITQEQFFYKMPMPA